MSQLRILLIGLLLSLLLTSAFGQGGQVIIYSVPDLGAPALGCSCADPDPFPIGHSYCIYWDNNNNGPDAADQLVEVGEGYGEANFACASFQTGGWDPGYFETDPAFYIANLPILPDVPVYYIKAGGDNCCWTSESFVLQVGFSTLFFDDTSWNCTASACGGAITPPPATNVQATDDALCMQIGISWEHTGEDVTSFNIYMDDVFALSALPTSRDTVIFVQLQGQKNISVRAANQQQESEPASDLGSMYLRRFANGPTGDLSGDFGAGAAFTLQLSRPDLGECGAYLELSLLVNNQIHSVLCEENTFPLILELNCNLPEPTSTLTNCRLLLTVTPTGQPQLSYMDTTESTFTVGPVDAPERPDFQVSAFGIAQNYPNPFNASTELQFNLPVTSEVRIDIYNIYGQSIATLVSGTLSAGTHMATWNATSTNGASVSSGIYLFRMTAGEFHAAGKMMLLR